MKKKLSTILIIIIVFALLLVAITACSKPDLNETTGTDDPTAEDTIDRTTQVVKNGTFYKASDKAGKTDYLKETVDSWSVKSGSLSATTDSNASGVTHGVVDLADKDGLAKSASDLGLNTSIEFDSEHTPYDEINTDEYQDKKALLLSYEEQDDVKKGSFYYQSNAVSIPAGKKYKLVFSVLTLIDDETDATKNGALGAWVEVRGDIYAKYEAIKTGGAWKQYALYIEGNETTALSINILLWLGYGPKHLGGTADNPITNPNLVSGAALFDNVICTEISDADYQTGVSTVDKTTIKKYSAKYLNDPNFVNGKEYTGFYSSSVTYSTAQYFDSFRSYDVSTQNTTTDYTFKAGGKDVVSAPTITTGFTGVVDLGKLYNSNGEFVFKDIDSWKKFTAPDTYANIDSLLRKTENLDENRALMLYYNDFGGATYSTKSIKIDKVGCYKITVQVYVWRTNEAAYPVYSGAVPKKITESGNTYTSTTTGLVNTTADIVNKVKAVYSGLGSDEASKIEEALKKLLGTDKTGTTDGDLKVALDDYNTKKAASDADPDDTTKKGSTDEAKATYDLLNDIKLAWNAYKVALDDYDTDKAEYDAKYTAWKDGTNKPKATIRLSGAGEDYENYDETTDLNKWESLTLFVKGNALSDRSLSLEMVFGEGEENDYNTLMIGGALFDNITIEKINEPSASDDYKQIDPFTAEDIAEGYTDIIGRNEKTLVENSLKVGKQEEMTALPTFSKKWFVNLDTDVAVLDYDKIDSKVVNLAYFGENPKPIDELISLKVGDSTTTYNLLMLNQTDYTASVTRLNDYIEINPNGLYRLAMWVKTEDIKEGNGISITLVKSDDKDKDISEWEASTAKIDTINTEEWTEIVFKITGHGSKTNYASIYIEFGDGTRFNTENYLKGKAYLTAMTMQKVDSFPTESTTRTGSFSFMEESNTTLTVTNGNFEKIDAEKTASNDKTSIDENGNLVGVGVTSSWTVDTTVENKLLNKVGSFEIKGKDASREYFKENFILYWENVSGLDELKPTGYEIYMKNFKDKESNKEVKSRLVGYISADGTTKLGIAAVSEYKENKFYVKVPTTMICSFSVKAVSDSSLAAESSEKTNIATSTGSDGDTTISDIDVTELPKSAYEAKRVVAGTVNVKTHENNAGVKDLTNVFTENFEASETPYVSPYDTILMIDSNYLVQKTLSSPSLSVTSGSYYVLSVWVKTVGDALASITVDGGTTSLATLSTTDGTDYVGYVNQSTGGKWREYRFYFKGHELNSTSVFLNLSLGNPSAGYGYVSGKIDTTTAKETDKTKAYKGLSKGTVYFDNVKFYNLESDVAYKVLGVSESSDETKAYAKTSYEDAVSATVTYTDPATGAETQVTSEYLSSREGKDSGTENEIYNYPVYEARYANTYAFKNLELNVDSFDSFTENTYIKDDTSTDVDVTTGKHWLFGHTGSGYDHAFADDAVKNLKADAGSSTTEDDDVPETINLLYGIYSKDNAEQLKYLWKKDGEDGEEKVFDFLPDGFDIADFVKIDGTYSLVMSNLVDNGQTYNGKDLSLAAESYYKLTFKAKAAVKSGTFAQARVNYVDKDKKDQFFVYKITENANNEYSFYFYNQEKESKTISLSFMLGGYEIYDENGKETDDTTKISGLFAADSVSLISIDKDAYESGISAVKDLSLTERETQKVNFYQFSLDESKEEEGENEEGEDENDEGEKTTVFDRGEIWLLVSSIVIGVIIVITIVVFVIKKWRKKHPKKEKVENNVKTVKKIEVIQTNTGDKKVDISSDDEYSDVPTTTVTGTDIVYRQRVNPKKKKK